MCRWLLIASLIGALPLLGACAPSAAPDAAADQRPAVARPIPGARPPPERVLQQASPDCPATPVEVFSGPAGTFFERDGRTVRVREPEGPWRAGQPRELVLLPTLYYTEPTLEMTAERLDRASSSLVFFGHLEGPGYQLAATLPESGCWRLTAHMGSDMGSVIVRVEP
jgi:hypothetical protein